MISVRSVLACAVAVLVAAVGASVSVGSGDPPAAAATVTVTAAGIGSSITEDLVPPPFVAASGSAAEASRGRIEARRPAIRVDGGQASVADVEAAPGVVHASAIRRGRAVIGPSQDATHEITIAAVDPTSFRLLVPQPTADAGGLWERLDEGAIVLTHERAHELGLELGGWTELGWPHPRSVRVGAFATNGTPPIADAVITHAAWRELGLGGGTTAVLAAVEDGASPEEVADDLRARVDGEVEVIPDPRRVQRHAAVQRPEGASVWDVLALCESSGDWYANTGNGFYGGLQFLPESWRLVGGTGMPHEASREEQIHRAELLLRIQGWEAWPVCSVKLGLRPPPASPGT